MPDNIAENSATNTTVTKDPPLMYMAILVILGIVTWIFPALIAIQLVKRQNKKVWNDFQQNDIILAIIYTVILAIFGLYVLAKITFIGVVWILIYLITFVILWFTGRAQIKVTQQCASNSSLSNGPPIGFI